MFHPTPVLLISRASDVKEASGSIRCAGPDSRGHVTKLMHSLFLWFDAVQQEIFQVNLLIEKMNDYTSIVAQIVRSIVIGGKGLPRHFWVLSQQLSAEQNQKHVVLRFGFNDKHRGIEALV